MQFQNQIMMNEGNKCLPPSIITLPPHRGTAKIVQGGKKMCALRAQLEIFGPTLAKTYTAPLRETIICGNILGERIFFYLTEKELSYFCIKLTSSQLDCSNSRYYVIIYLFRRDNVTEIPSVDICDSEDETSESKD